MSIIKVENLSKKYLISHGSQERYTAMRDVLANKVKKLFSFPKSLQTAPKNTIEEFYALKEINFEIEQGDRVGIIGRNGAGKSTLLKVLSRITEPSTGKITINGRVASLLEVGTGFHPELTGRENIFLNGAILGMSRMEIRKHFDAIVDFAETEKFLDTPVKRYSSGMYIRLAFAVAAHLEPEILVVDEVLAVGDAQFQKKCLGKMEDVSKNEGRTVLFVSHNMVAVRSLCTSSIILHKGEKILQGAVNDSLMKYMSFEQTELNNQSKFLRTDLSLKKGTYISKVELFDDQSMNYFCLQMTIKIHSSVSKRVGINIRLKDGMGFPVAAGFTHYFMPELFQLEIGENDISVATEKLNLAIGIYKLSIEIVVPGVETIDNIEDCLQFELNNDGLSQRNYGIVQSWGFGSIEIKFKKYI